MTLEWLLALAVGWGPHLAGEDKMVEAQAVAQAVYDCAARESFDGVMVEAVIAQESGFNKDPCRTRVRLDRVLSRTPDAEHEDREVVEWTCSSTHGTRPPCSRHVWQVEECGDFLCFDTCPAGEVGYMQVLRSSEYARAGYPIPGTEHTMGVMGGTVDFKMTVEADLTQLTTAVLVNGERLSRSAFVVTSYQDGDRILSSVALNAPPSEGATVTVAEALSTESRVRREQLLTARINIALGCAELADHRESAGKTADDPWWEWIGSYNTGTTRGPASHRYARRIAYRYRELCNVQVPTEDGLVMLRDVYPACATVDEAYDDEEMWKD